MIWVLIIIAVLLLWLVRIGYQVCKNQVNTHQSLLNALQVLANQLDKMNSK